MVVDTSSQNFLPTQVSLDSISLPAAPEKEATVGTETPLSGQPVQEPEQEPGSRKGNNIISENGGGQKSYKNSKEEKEEEQEEAAPAEPIQPALPEPVPEAVTEEPSFTETYALPLAIGGGVVFAIAAAILIAVLTGKKRKRMQRMTEEPTFEPYAGGSIDSAVKVLLDDKNSPVFIGRVHGVGKRSMQQDSFGISEVEDLSTVRKKGVMAIVADGMGGLSDGERMSQMVVVTMLQGFDSSKDDAVASSTLLGLVGEANTAVNNDLGPECYGKCGSTVVAVIVRNKQLSWISVGDSHIYVYRKGQLIKLNTDHNYGTQLDERVKKGEISFEEAATDPQRAALTSFIGIGELELIDQNETPIALESGDRILLMSDGVYGTVEERAMTELLALPFRKALSALGRAVEARDKKNQDNYTCVMLEIR